jgi:hypothetical protein
MILNEFGSDFHFEPIDTSYSDSNDRKNYYATGRHALQHLISRIGWKRIWLPTYYCEDVIDSLTTLGISIKYYRDAPGNDDFSSISMLSFKPGDVLLRINYFGIRSFRNNGLISVDVIEDHTHDLVGDWAINSNADWCFASLRKILPIASGGVLWSPKGHELPKAPPVQIEFLDLLNLRNNAMFLKYKYFTGEYLEKEKFLEMFRKTESQFKEIPISGLPEIEKLKVINFNIDAWNEKKRKNWLKLGTLKSPIIKIYQPEHINCNIFSFVFLLKSNSIRDKLKNALVEKNIYPAILWHNSLSRNLESQLISSRMLSIHCDGRYSESEVNLMFTIIKDALSSIID